MSGSSELKYRVRGTASVLYDADDASVGDKVTRYHVVNNLNHYADIHGQQRVHWSARALGPAKTPYLATVATGYLNVLTSAPFPIALRPDGSSYRVRIRIGGCVSNALGGPGKFAVMLSTPYARDAPYRLLTDVLSGALATDQVWISNDVNSTTPAFLTGKSKGVNGWDNMIALTAAEAAPFMTTISVPVDISGASAGLPVCMVQVMIFAGLGDSAYEARLYYADATEFYGE